MRDLSEVKRKSRLAEIGGSTGVLSQLPSDSAGHHCSASGRRLALMYFDVPAHDVLRVASAIRHERYDQARGKRDSGLSMMSQIGEIARQLDFTWVGMPPDSPFDGRTLGDLRIRTTTGASVVGIIRDDSLVANPVVIDSVAEF